MIEACQNCHYLVKNDRICSLRVAMWDVDGRVAPEDSCEHYLPDKESFWRVGDKIKTEAE